MSLRKLVWSAGALAAISSPALCPGVVLAQAPGGENAAMFKKLDTDGDGKLTKEELPEEQRRLFERLVETQDKDKDGKLSSDEFAAGLNEDRPRGEAGTPGGPNGRPGMAGNFNPDMLFGRFDRNGDGKLTKDEGPEEGRERFEGMIARVDQDGDGAATREEFRRGFGAPGAPPNSGNPQNPQQPGRPNSAGVPGMPGMPGGGFPGPGSSLIAALDKDRNGEISSDEIASPADALKKLDRDGDGKLTQREIMPPRPEGAPTGGGFSPDPERMLAFFKQGDRNGDGKLQKEETTERMRENFAELDGNGDGALDDKELRQVAERFARAGMMRPGARPENRPEGRPEGRPENNPEMRRPDEGRPSNDDAAAADPRFGEADKNRDGKLSKDEVPQRVRERFAQIDADGDGFISPPEMREAGQRMRRRSEQRPEQRRPETEKPSDATPSVEKPKDSGDTEGKNAESAKRDKDAPKEVLKQDD